MKIRNETPQEYELASWYASEGAKRALGRICQEVNRRGETIAMLGTEAQPLLFLADADLSEETADEIVLTIDEAKADWAAVTTAASIYGTRFRIKGKKLMRAVLYRNPDVPHPAERYVRSKSGDANALAERIEAIAKDVRTLGKNLSRIIGLREEELSSICDRLASSADTIDRRFRAIWRKTNGHSAPATSGFVTH